MLVLLFFGMPVCAGLAMAGLFGTLLTYGFGGISELGHLTWSTVTKYGLMSLPGFVLMGVVFADHDFGADLFDTTQKWLGWLPGGLVAAATAMGALFGFICGSGTAGVATIGKLAIPEVEKRGYDRRLSLGAFAIAGTLAVMIPPSVLMILYAVMAEVSLGHLFFAGIIPGLMLTGLITLYVVGRVILNPQLAPRTASTVVLKDKLRSLTSIIPVAICFIVILGGIYSGVWSPTEAGGVGAILAIIICLGYRRTTAKKLLLSLGGAVKICGMVYMIIVGAQFLSYFVFVSGFQHVLAGFVTGTGLPSWAVITTILIILTIMGCFMDVLALVMISIPVFLPIVTSVGMDPIWFGIVLILESELALITPPVGLNLYVIHGLAPKGTKMSDIVWGVFPYVGVVWVLLVLMVVWPQIVLWLPSTMILQP